MTHFESMEGHPKHQKSIFKKVTHAPPKEGQHVHLFPFLWYLEPSAGREEHTNLSQLFLPAVPVLRPSPTFSVLRPAPLRPPRRRLPAAAVLRRGRQRVDPGRLGARGAACGAGRLRRDLGGARATWGGGRKEGVGGKRRAGFHGGEWVKEWIRDVEEL